MGVLIVAFVGWLVFDVGMDVGGRGGSSGSLVVARVNGEKIEYQEFYSTLRLAQDQQRRAGNPANTMDEVRALEDQILESLVQQIALGDEYRRRGIRLTDREISEAMRNQPLPEFLQEPTFQTEGQFDLSKYQRFIETQTNEYQLQVEARYRQELPQIKLYQRLVGDVYVTDAQLWRLFQDEVDSVAVNLITLLPQAVIGNDEVEVSDEDIASYYAANAEQYERAASAYLSYVSVPRIPNSSDSVAALQRAQDVLTELRDGADFAEMALRESADSGSRENGGDLGEVSRGQHVSVFSEAALALQPGEISEPVLSEFGYHIIKLQSKTEDTYHASHILIAVELDGDHLTEVESRGDSLDFYAAEQDDPSVLDSIAVSMGLEVMTADPLVQGGQLWIGNDLIPDVAIWAFESLAGETSHVIETDRAFYVFRIDRVVPEGIAPLEEVRQSVAFDATLAAKWEKLADVASAIRSDLESGMSFEEVAGKHGVRSTELPPFTRLVPNPALMSSPEVVGTAFGLAIGQWGGPVQTEEAMFFVQPTFRQTADSTLFAGQIDALRERALNSLRQLRIRMALASIRQSADVEDLRVQVAQALRADPGAAFPGGPLGF
jgi:peptidyl-prolyl cis-trans isomerase D